MIEITAAYLASQGLSPTAPIRFLDKVNKDGPSGCWEWTAGHCKFGYGRFYGGTGHKNTESHIISWMLFRGPIPEGMCVLHNCPIGDNPRCVNPDHLWLGTKGDNNRDRNLKGRTKLPPNREQHHLAKLDWSKVAVIRLASASGVTQRTLANLFGVSKHSIYGVVKFMSWKF